MAELEGIREGWGFTGRSNKAHYFVQTMALCRKWGFYGGPLEPDTGPSPDDCVQCRRLLDKRPGAALGGEE